MRFTSFSGLLPKVKPQGLDMNHAQVAHNLDVDSSGTLVGLHAPGHADTAVSVSGGTFVGEPATLHRAGGHWVAFGQRTSIAHDTQGPLQYGAFLFVQDQRLHWQSPERIAAKLAPVAVGVCAPTLAPSAVAIEGLGCVEQHSDLPCVTDPLAPGGVCLPQTPILRMYVHTWVRQYPGCEGREEESAPSPPVEIECLDTDAPSVTTSEPLPAGVTSVRWYRSAVSSKGQVVMLFCGETRGTTLVDMACASALGEPLRTVHHFPPPGCVDGVANLGDALVLVWSGKRFWVSQPFKPYAFDVDRDEFVLGFDIVGILGHPDHLEGAETYEAHALTTGRPYRITGSHSAVIDVREVEENQPCVSPDSICQHEGATLYASPYGLVRFTGEALDVLTSEWLTTELWRSTSPQHMRVAAWDDRVFMMFRDRDGWLMNLAGARPKALVTHSVRAGCLWVDAEHDLHLTNSRPQVWRWGTGQPMRWTWRSASVVQAGLWKPSAAKVVGDVRWQWHDIEAELLAFNAWKASHVGLDTAAYFEAHPSAMHLQAQLDGGYCHHVEVLAEGRLVYQRRVTNARPFRLPRRTRALEWAIEVSGYGTVREVHIQTSLADLAQDGGHA